MDSSPSSFSSPIQRPIVFLSGVDPIDSEAKRELQNWKPRQRQTPIVDLNVHYTSAQNEHLLQDRLKEEREILNMIADSFNKTPTRWSNSPANIQESLQERSDNFPARNRQSPSEFITSEFGTPKRWSSSPAKSKLITQFNTPPLIVPKSPTSIYPVIHRPSSNSFHSPARRSASPKIRNLIDADFTSPGSSSDSSSSADKTLTPQDFGQFEEEENDKFEAVFKQLNRGISDLRNTLTRNPTKQLADSRFYDLQKSFSDRSLSNSSESRIVNHPPRQVKHHHQSPNFQAHQNTRAHAYSINTELNATFNLPKATSSKSEVEVCKTLARAFIDRTKEVYKLRVAIRNHEVNDANNIGDSLMASRLRAEEIDLVNEFNKWKHTTKNHYKQLLSLEKDTQALRQVISDLEQKIKHAQREADRLCNAIEAHEKRVVPSSDKVVQTTERLAQRPEPLKNLLNASDQRVESVMVQRSAQTSSFASQRFVEQEVQQVKHVQQLRYNTNPLNEPLFGKASNVESVLSKQAEDSDHNSSIVSLVEDENVLGFTKSTASVLNKSSSPENVPLLNFNPLNISRPPIQPITPALEERSASTANTEHDVSSIDFDEQSVSEFAKSPVNKSPPTEQQNEPSEKEQTVLNVSSHSIGEVLPSIDEIEVQNEALDAHSEHLINESIVELEETKEEFRPLEAINAIESESLSEKVVESAEPAKSIKIDAKSLSVDEIQSVESVVDKAVNLTEEEIHVEHMTSESVASELLSSALDDSLAQLDELAQDSSQPSNKSSSSVASTAKSSSQKNKKSSSSSLKSPPTASDKSILKASSFKISSEMQSSVDSKHSKNKTVSDASSSSDF